jgi:protease I
MQIVKRTLEGKKIAVLAADGFEMVEYTVPVNALRMAGAQVEVISLRPGRIRGVNLHEPSHRVSVDRTIDRADPFAYDGLFIPGGLINPDLLRQSKAAREFVRGFDGSGKPIASLCHAPWLLASTGLAQGRVLTSWPGIRDDLVNAGATWLDQEVVQDGNWITSRGPQDLRAFVPAILEFFAQREHRAAPQRRQGAQSSPQREEPPTAMLQAMKWMPKPSVRAVVGLGAVVAGALIARRRLAA